MQEYMKKAILHVRTLGFKGSGQTLRKFEDDFVLVVNFQKSSSGDKFFINLGAQPFCISGYGEPELKQIKEYECVFRKRVGQEWRLDVLGIQFDCKLAEITAELNKFSSLMLTLKDSIRTASALETIDKYCIGTTLATATLHLAKACLAFGENSKAKEIIRIGLKEAGPAAIGLRWELQELDKAIST